MTTPETADKTDHASKVKGLIWLLAACAMAACFALGIEPFVRAVPWSWEQQMAEWPAFQAPHTACKAPGKETKEILKHLVTRLYPAMPDDDGFSIDITIVKDKQINAYATLGGKIYVNSGFLAQAQSPEELAGVLAHEIGHVHHRHILQGIVVQMLTSQGISFIFSGGTDVSGELAGVFLGMAFSRKQEAQADNDGLSRLQASHIDNKGFKSFFRRMEDSSATPEFLSDHPSNDSRFEMADDFKNEKPVPVMTPAEWTILKDYCK